MSTALSAIFMIAIIFIALMLVGCSEEIRYSGLSETPHDHPNLVEPTDDKINLYVDFEVEEKK